MKLWIDDLRPAPVGWVQAFTSSEALAMIADGGAFEEMSFDHDLGGDDTTRPVVLHLAEHELFPPVCRVHTANPVGREWLVGMIGRYGPGVTR